MSSKRIIIKASTREPLTNREADLATKMYNKYREILDLLEIAPDKLVNSSTIFDDITDEMRYLENLWLIKR